MAERLLTVLEIAERLRLNPQTVRRWLKDGKLKGIWMGSDKAGWRMSESALREYMEHGSER